MELQRISGELETEGVALFAISYDPVEALAAFAAKRAITFTLLSDEGSRVIREFGLLNEHLFEQHAAYNIPRNDAQYGVPYPGVFVLDQAGAVVDRRFYQSYRERETGTGLLEDALYLASQHHGSEARTVHDVVEVRAYLDSPTFAFYQRLRLTVELTIAPGFHVYGRPIPDGYVPVTIDVEPSEGVVIGDPRWPAPHPFRIAGLDEEFQVYDGVVRASLPLTFAVPPGAGDQTITVAVTTQACDAKSCLAPARTAMSLPAREVGLVDRPLPGART